MYVQEREKKLTQKERARERERERERERAMSKKREQRMERERLFLCKRARNVVGGLSFLWPFSPIPRLSSDRCDTTTLSPFFFISSHFVLDATTDKRGSFIPF